ncbi:pirin family protein [Spirochaeta cellobiosiphila]|uniref:pirin family protein n=1 Tax=Spirochaeta cellobiosiphila TaxID=504483 RepID=UPI0003F53B60|nr:pirin-like bicupin family protein [Spirochaeta cellobiosiphila]
MITVRKADKMGSSHLGWLTSRFHFSFAEYYNPSNINYGVLRVLNDDRVQPGTGFDTHPHKDMEIISYIIQGELTHQDNMGHKRSLTRGMIQYMSAGTGVLHSEHNQGKDLLRFLQIWIFPTHKSLEPNYGDYEFPLNDREGKWLHMVSGQTKEAPVNIHQDANIHSLILQEEENNTFTISQDRMGYLVQIEGQSQINNNLLEEGDAAELSEGEYKLNTQTMSHYLLIEMAQQ